MDLKLDDGLKALIEQGKEKGYLTYGQVNDLLPDDAVNPEKLDQLLILLEEQGVNALFLALGMIWPRCRTSCFTSRTRC